MKILQIKEVTRLF